MGEPSWSVLVEGNEPLVDLLRAKREQLQADANVLREKGEGKRADGKLKYVTTIERAWHSVCDHRTAITTPQEAKKLKNVGNWILSVLEPFFQERNHATTQQPASQPLGTNITGANEKAKRKYIPAKNSGGYALLVTLLRAHESGKQFMMKKDLIDEADKTGLSTKPIRDSALPWTAGQPNPKDMYSGWSNMSTLIRKSLVVKSSNPAKYKLTDEGKSVAQQCVERTGLTRPGSCSEPEIAREEERRVSPVRQNSGECSFGRQESSSSDEDVQEIRRSDLTSQDKRKWKDNSHTSSSPAAVGIFDNTSVPSKRIFLGNSSLQAPPVACGADRTSRAVNMDLARNSSVHYSISASRVQGNVTPELSSVDPEFELAVPPLEPGEKFCDAYEIICILDKREQFRKKTGGTHLQDFIESLTTQFGVKVETRVLHVGDTLWIARHKQHYEEYVLEFVLERKSAQDLWQSIKDNRYKQQKLRLMNCGLKGLLYLVEGDVNQIESTEALKTAMFTTELHGFRLLRTDDTADTCKQYGHLTKAIISRYSGEVGKGGRSGQVGKTYKAFVEHCRNFDKDRVRDVFCRQLTQVTEEIACSIQDRYPTVSSIAAAFEALEGNQEAQEKLLHGIPIRNTSKIVSAVLSKNIYKAIWAP